jgi:hypothetical protein
MKKLFSLAISLTIIGFIFIIGCDQQSDNPVQADLPVQAPLSEIDDIGGIAKAGNNGPAASGQGTLIYEDGHRRIFTFHATTDADGIVKGAGVLRKVSSDPEQREKIHFDIDCLTVDGNAALMSGIITRADPIIPNPSDPVEVGEFIQFKVIDNGEGSDADPDLMSYFNHGFEVPSCDQEDVSYALFEINAGNIQVKP